MSRATGNQILIVEDQPGEYQLAEMSLREAGLANTLIWCSSGEDALDYLYRRGKHAKRHEQMPVMILLDLGLGSMSGKEVLRKIKKDPVFKRIPVIIMSTSRDEQTVTECYRLGANSYLAKPLGVEELFAAISAMHEFWFGISILKEDERSR